MKSDEVEAESVFRTFVCQVVGRTLEAVRPCPGHPELYEIEADEFRKLVDGLVESFKAGLTQSLISAAEVGAAEATKRLGTGSLGGVMPLPTGFVEDSEAAWIAVPVEQFRTLLWLWCKEFAGSIYIHTCKGPKAFSEMTEEQQRAFVDDWYKRRVLPVRMKEPESDD